MYYPERMKARVSPVQWSKPNSIFAPTQDSNPGGRIQNHKRWPLHYHCTPITSVRIFCFQDQLTTASNKLTPSEDIKWVENLLELFIITLTSISSTNNHEYGRLPPSSMRQTTKTNLESSCLWEYWSNVSSGYDIKLVRCCPQYDIKLMWHHRGNDIVSVAAICATAQLIPLFGRTRLAV